MSTVTLPPPAKPRSTTPIPERALADIVAGLAAAPTLWRGFVPALSERSSVHLLATEAYDVWLIGWPPGNRVEPHDHGDSAGAFTVVRGALTEYRWSPDGLPRPRVVDTGGVVTIDARVVHDVVADRADEDGPAISIHAYSPPLRVMGFYSDDGTRLLTRVAIESEATEPT